MAAAQYYEQIQQAYLAYYGRPADPQGLVYWATQLDNAGGNLSAIINAFGTSAESESLYGSTAGAAQIAAIYQQLFGRAPDATGLTFYVNGLATGQFTLASIALNIYNGASGTDLTALQSKLAYADAFTNALESSVEGQIAYSGNAAAANARAAVSGVADTASEQTAENNLSSTISNISTGTVGNTYTLTSGVDNVTVAGNNGVVNAVLATGFPSPATSTLTNLDKISATGTNETLNINDVSGGIPIPTAITVSGIQTVNLTSTNTVGADDFSHFTGLNTVNVKEAGGAADITAATTTAVNVTDSAQAAGAINIVGGSNVAVTAAGVTTGAINVGTAAAAVSGTIAVTTTTAAAALASSLGTVTGTQGTITTTGGTTVNVTENLTAPTVANTTGTTATTVGGAVNVNGTAATTTVAVSQSAAVTAVAGAVAQPAIPGTGTSQALTFGDLPMGPMGTITVNGVTVTAGPVIPVIGTSLAQLFTAEANGDTATVATLTSEITTSGGSVSGSWLGGYTAANIAATNIATFVSTATGPTAPAIYATVIELGADITFGTITPGTAGQNAVTAATAVGGVSDGLVTVTDVNYNTTKLGTISSVTLNNFSAGATIDDNAVTSLSLSGKGGVVALNDAGLAAANAVTTLTVNVSDLSGTTLTDQNIIKTLNVATGGDAASSLAFNDTALTTVNVSGTENVTLDLTGATAVTAINASGAAGVTTTLTNAAEAFTSTGTGADVLTIASGVGATAKGYTGNITLGSGENSLLAADPATYFANGSTINGGTSGHNTISASLVANSLGATIENFQTLDVSNFIGNTLDASLLTSTISGAAISFAGTSSTLDNLASSVTVTDSYDGEGGVLTLTHAGTATNSLAVAFADTTANGSQVLAINSTGDSTVTVAAGGVKGIADYLSLTETDNHLSTVTISGSNALTLTLNLDTADRALTTLTGNVASALTSIDGSAATGALTVTAGASIATATLGDSLTFKGLTIHGGIGGDTIENDAANGMIVEGATAANSTTNTHFNTLTVTGANASINDSASAANDVLHLNGANDSATLGSGNVSVTVGAATSTAWGANVTFGTGTANVSDSLAFGAGTDTAHANVLTLAGTLSGNEVTFANAANLTAGTLGSAYSFSGQTTANLTFAQLVQLAAGGATPTANAVSWFQFGGNTYVVDTSATPATTSTAQVVKIAGTVDLSHATIDSTTHALHFA